MHDSLHVNSQVGLLEPLDYDTAPQAVWEKRECVPRELLEDRVVVPAGQWHRMREMCGGVQAERAATGRSTTLCPVSRLDVGSGASS
jgi:hypothetical protein